MQVIDDKAEVMGIQTTDPGFLNVTRQNYDIQFPALFTDGDAPDTALPPGTELTATVKAENNKGDSVRESNTVMPLTSNPADSAGPITAVLGGGTETFSTDTIANVEDTPLIPFTMPNLGINGGLWFDRTDGPFTISWSGAVANQDYIRFIWANTEANSLSINGDVIGGPFTLYPTSPVGTGTGVLMKVSASSGTATVTLNGHVGNSQNNFLIPEGTTGYSEVTAKAFENIAPPVTLLTFPTDNNFNKFEVGDVVQGLPGATVTAIGGNNVTNESNIYDDDSSTYATFQNVGSYVSFYKGDGDVLPVVWRNNSTGTPQTISFTSDAAGNNPVGTLLMVVQLPLSVLTRIERISTHLRKPTVPII